MSQFTGDWPDPPLMEGPPGAMTRIDGREYLYFGGTSYLGLSGHPAVIEAGIEALRRGGVHTATSRSGFGNSPAVLEVERRAAEFFATEDSFYFASGYLGAAIVVRTAADGADAVFIDEAAHYALQDAALLAALPIFRFRHRDPNDLREKLAASGKRRPLVLTDGVFSLTGAVAPIDRYVELLRGHDGRLLVDDAHGIGTVGANGRGTLEHFGLLERLGRDLFVCGTLSKAVGGFGGIVPGSREYLHRVRQASHYYAGASAPMSAAAGATAKALEIAYREPQLRERLQANARRLRSGLGALGLSVEDWPTPIVSLELGTSDNMRRIHAELRRRGIIVPCFASYSGCGAAGRLRIAVFASHTAVMIDRLVGELAKLV